MSSKMKNSSNMMMSRTMKKGVKEDSVGICFKLIFSSEFWGRFARKKVEQERIRDEFNSIRVSWHMEKGNLFPMKGQEFQKFPADKKSGQFLDGNSVDCVVLEDFWRWFQLDCISILDISRTQFFLLYFEFRRQNDQINVRDESRKTKLLKRI